MPASVHSLPPKKKRRIQGDNKTIESIKLLEETVTTAVTLNASLNPLVDLLDLVLKTKDAAATSKGIYALYRVFVILISTNKLGIAGDESARIVKNWLLDQVNKFVDYLASLLQDGEKALRLSALDILMSLQKHLSTSATNAASTSNPQPQFHNAHFRKIVNALIICPPSLRKTSSLSLNNPLHPDILHKFHETWFSVHDDIRWFLLREAATLLQSHLHELYPYAAANLLSILEALKTFPTGEAELNAWWISELGAEPPKPKRSTAPGDEESDDEGAAQQDGDEEDWRKFFDDEPTPKERKRMKGPGVRLNQLTTHQSLHSLASHKAVFTKCWLVLLPRLSEGNVLVTSKSLVMRTLNVMHQGVLPHLTRPILIMDWIGGCVDYGQTVGLLALNALFILIKDYNLDYPSFYTRLYSFLDRELLHLKHRARFFRLTELFLSSTHLPATLLASFVKRLARLSLSAPPAAIIMIIPFTYNILKQHPALMVMIHRPGIDGEDEDPFQPEETNPLLTQALSSSLWELNSHLTHYHSGVSSLVKVFSEPFSKPAYPLEDFLDHTYSTLFETDIKRTIKKEPPFSLELGKVPNLFPLALEQSKQEERNGEVDKENDGEETPTEELGLSGDIVSELWEF